MYRIFMPVALVVMASWSQPLLAGDPVYKCKDENGKVSYQARACDGTEQVEKLPIRTSRTDSDEVEARARARRELLDSYAEQREARAAERAEAQAEREKKKQACEAARAELQKANQAKRMSRGEGDNKTYLSNEEISALKAERQTKVREACGR
ncbi:MAG: DUF4124 domain-containing protein [Gammaproteobacteria bacterium]|nr:DUF4124 domain-containing protein [Gammaproteobacteria bacterium]